MIFEMHFLVSRPPWAFLYSFLASPELENPTALTVSFNVASEKNTHEYQLLSLTVHKCGVLWRF